MKLWKGAAAAGILGAAVLMAGCGSSEGSSSASAANEKTYVVATRGTAKPVNYVDDQGNLTGFDVEVMKEIDRRDPTIHFEFKAMAIDAAFIAMDSGQVDVVVNQMRATPAREKKYIIPEEYYDYSARRFVVKKGRTDIQTIDDLKGKTIAVTTNGGMNTIVTDYNKTADPKINVIYSDKGAVETMNLVATGRADASAEVMYTAKSMIEDKGLPLELSGPIVAGSVSKSYPIIRRSDDTKELADKIDQALKAMRADGTLKKLSEKYLGGDYTTVPAE